jgi:hypothetical protein
MRFLTVYRRKLDEVPVDADLISRLLPPLQRFREHQLAHPVNSLVARSDAEVVALARSKTIPILHLWDKGEGEGRLAELLVGRAFVA